MTHVAPSHSHEPVMPNHLEVVLDCLAIPKDQRDTWRTAIESFFSGDPLKFYIEHDVNKLKASDGAAMLQIDGHFVCKISCVQKGVYALQVMPRAKGDQKGGLER